MDAPVHSKCSFTWRSILKSRDVIDRGAIWRVGDGASIEIWKIGNSKINSPRPSPSMSRAKDLFIPGTRSWDSELMQQCFLPWEVEAIQSIHVLQEGSDDVLVWPLTSDGSYTVRSAYRMLVENDSSEEPSSSSMQDSNQVWKSIWKIKCPNKVRHFMWRVPKDSLPTKQNLRLKHIPVDETCSNDDHPETLLHCLWLCDHAQFVRKSDPSFTPLYGKKHRSFRDLVEEVLSTKPGYKAALFSTVALSLWQRRNRLREKQATWPLHEVGERSKALLQEFVEANTQAQQRSPRLNVRWTAPQENCYKANFDPAIFREMECAGDGMC